MHTPNLFIIGAQKAGTTSLHNWLMQHPDIFSSLSLKDRDIFGSFFKDGTWRKILDNESKKIVEEKYFLQSHVNYIMYQKSLENIKLNTIAPKFIFVKRDPVERAISAYKYFIRRNREFRTLKKALIYTPKNIKHIDTINPENNNLTYIEHGFYEDQLKRLYSLFGENQVLILEFEDLKNRPEDTLRVVFDWLKIDKVSYIDLKSTNVGGRVKSEFINNLLFNSNRLKKSFMILVKLFISQNMIDEIKEKIYQNNISKSSFNESYFSEEELAEVRKYLIKIYSDKSEIDIATKLTSNKLYK